jgi:predicted RNase H-like HicB family nuclease
MAEYGYNVIYEQLAEGGYQVIVPALSGIVTYGRTLDEAREMARDAIVCHTMNDSTCPNTLSRASFAKPS